MPELPEVETIRRQLSEKIIGRKLGSQEIVRVRRRGKILIIDFKHGPSLLFHLKLTGQLIFNGKPSRFTRKVFHFKDGTTLIFNDARRFGWWKKVKNTDVIEKRFGPEALEISFKDFQKALKSHPNMKIKPLLMDQKIIAGIGNIYSDEILFASKVLPYLVAKTLTEKEAKQIHFNTRKILKAAILRRGSSVEYYIDACGKRGDFLKYHKVYQKEICPVCGGKIKEIKLGGRTAHFCPNCQKL